jgi:hypothetical protein
MSRRIITALVAVFMLTGCTSSTLKVSEHLNNREFYYNRYIEECVSVAGPPSCETFQKEVNRYKVVIVEAEAADKRGGKYPLQLKELKLQLKKVSNARNSGRN